MKYIVTCLHIAALCAGLVYSPQVQSFSLTEVTAWLIHTLGFEANADTTRTRIIPFENDLIDAITMYDIHHAYRHWPVQLLNACTHDEDDHIIKTKTQCYYSETFTQNIFDNLEFYEQVIQALDLDADDTYSDACEILVELINPECPHSTWELKQQDTLITLLDSLYTKKNIPITVDDIEHNPAFEHIKATLHNAVLLTRLFDKIGKTKLIKLWKTISIKVNGIELPHDYITNVPISGDTCTISATLPIETFVQLLEAQGLRDILSDDPLQDAHQCLIDIQQFLQEHTWICAIIKHLQQHDSIIKAIVARYVNMQVVFTYTFDVKEFESDSIRINYLLLSQLNKWTKKPPTVTTHYLPFKTIEIRVSNQ